MMAWQRVLLAVVLLLAALAVVFAPITEPQAPFESKREPVTMLDATRSHSSAKPTADTAFPDAYRSQPNRHAQGRSSRIAREQKPHLDDKYAWDVTKKLEELRRGDIVAARQLMELLHTCAQVPVNEAQLAEAVWLGRRLGRGAEQFFEGTEVLDPEELKGLSRSSNFWGEHNRFPDPADHYRAKLDFCQPLEQLLEGGLMDELRSLARAGNAAATWVYVLTRLTRMSGSANFHEHLLWQAEARRLVERLESTDPAVAYSIAGFSRFWAAYTPYDNGLGAAYLLAAANCGASDTWLPAGWRMVFESRIGKFSSRQRSTREAEAFMDQRILDCVMGER